MAREVYVSVDIEADGPYPGGYSMLSLGAAAFVLPNREPIAKFEMNLAPLEGAGQHPDTMKWWEGQPEAWAHSTKDPVPPEEAMKKFAAWANSLRANGSPVLVTFPTWDNTWIHYYMGRFVGENPFGIGSLDIKSLAMGVLRNDSFKGTAKRSMPKRWFHGSPSHNHTALQDAIGQGVLLVNIFNERKP